MAGQHKPGLAPVDVISLQRFRLKRACDTTRRASDFYPELGKSGMPALTAVSNCITHDLVEPNSGVLAMAGRVPGHLPRTASRQHTHSGSCRVGGRPTGTAIAHRSDDWYRWLPQRAATGSAGAYSSVNSLCDGSILL